MFNSILSKNKLSKHIEFAQKGDIWRLFLNQRNILAGETRDTEKKRMYLFSLDHVTGQKYLVNYQCGDEWWESILDIDDELIYLGKYKKPDLPDLSGIKAVDIKSGHVKWLNDDVSYIFAGSNEVYAYGLNYGVKKYYTLDKESGNITGETDQIGLHELKLHKEKDNYRGFQYPEPHTGENIPKNYLTGIAGSIKINGNIEFVKFKEYLVYNYYHEKGVDVRDISRVNLDNTLEILDTSVKKVVFKEIINRDAHNFVPDSFFIKDGYLFFVKEKRKLISIDLN